jgi:carbon monoxide dehydrogenase subunit G
VAPIVSEVDIARPREEVFAYVTDPARFGEWQSGVVSGHIEGDGPLQVGSRCVMTRRIGGSNRTSVSEVTQMTPPEDWSIRGIDGPIRADVTVAVAPISDNQGSHVTIRLDFHGHGIGAVLLPMVVRQARKEVPRSCQNLKQRLEAVENRQA